MRFHAIIFILILTSCSTLQNQPVVREPAAVEYAKSCNEIMSNLILTHEYKADLTDALKAKKLITLKEKFMQIEFPRLEWINRVRKSFNISLKNWNNKLYPSFYLSNDEEVITIAKAYSVALEKELNNELDDEATKTLKMVRAWTDSYENYDKELNQLIDERISLQYNLSLLKKLDLEDQNRDIQLSFVKDGVITPEVFSLHPEEKTLKSLLGNLQTKINELDGGLIRDGKIKERIIRQAMLQDMLKFVQRELEYNIKNSDKVPVDVLREFDRMNKMMKNTDFSPSTYGVYKITNKVFISELMALSKLDIVYEKFKDPLGKMSKILSNFLDGSPGDKEKIGFFQSIYARITNLTPQQLTIGGTVTATAGFGTYRYFWFDKNATSVVPTKDAHQVQLEKTNEVILKKNNSHSKVIEVHINEEIKP